MTDAQVSQVAVEVVRTNLAVSAQVSQLAVEVLRPNVGRRISASAGSFVLTGVSSSGAYLRKLAGATGTFTLTGQSAAFLRGFKVGAAKGTFILTGQAAQFLQPSKLIASAGAFTLSGVAASLLYKHRLSSSAGAFTLTGQDSTGDFGYTLLVTSSGSFTLTGKSSAGQRPVDIIDPVSGKTLLYNLREVAATYTDADAAYNAWAAVLGVSNSTTDYTVSTTYTSTDFVPLPAPPIDYGTYASVDIAHGGAVAFYLSNPSITTGNWAEYATGSTTFGYINVPVQRPVFTVGALNNLTTSSYAYQNYSLKLKTGVNPNTDASETIVIFTRAQAATLLYPIRCAFRFCAGYFEAVFTVDPANIPSGGYARVSYIIASELSDIASSGGILNSSFSGTIQFMSDDLSELRPYMDEATVFAESSAAKYLTYPSQTDTIFPRDSVSASYALILNQNTVLDASATYVFRPGALIREVVALSEVSTPAWKFSKSLTESTAFIDALNAAFPKSIVDAITIGDAASIIRSILVLEQLGLLDPAIATGEFQIQLVDALQTNDSLRRFLGGSLADTVTISDALTPAPLLGKVITDTLNVSESASGVLLIRVTADDTFNLDDTTLTKWIFKPVVTDGIEISLGFVEPNGSFTSWAVNTRTGAVTEYQNFVFNSFAQIGHKYLGSSESGLYELDGDTDDGDDVIAQIRSGYAQFGGSKYSSFKAAYLGMRGNGDIILKLDAGDGNTYTYQTVIQDMQSTKVRLGKGLRARYFAFELVSTGPDFDLDTVEFLPLVAQRRV